MLMAWLPVLPTAAADSGSVIFKEDFESFSDGQALESGDKFILKNGWLRLAKGRLVKT